MKLIIKYGIENAITHNFFFFIISAYY